jgi:hypothetical protein
MWWHYRINVLAVLLTALEFMVLGAIWYHPRVFGARWMALIGKRPEDFKGKNNGAAYATAMVYALVTSFALAWVISRSYSWGWMYGLKVGAIAGIGFVFTSFSTDAIFNQRPRQLVLINAGYYAVALVLGGAIIGAMRY